MGLVAFGAFFLFLGVLFFFDFGFLAMGNVRWVRMYWGIRFFLMMKLTFSCLWTLLFFSFLSSFFLLLLPSPGRVVNFDDSPECASPCGSALSRAQFSTSLSFSLDVHDLDRSSKEGFYAIIYFLLYTRRCHKKIVADVVTLLILYPLLIGWKQTWSWGV